MNVVFGFLSICLGLGGIVYFIKLKLNNYQSSMGLDTQIFIGSIGLIVCGLIILVKAFN